MKFFFLIGDSAGFKELGLGEAALLALGSVPCIFFSLKRLGSKVITDGSDINLLGDLIWEATVYSSAIWTSLSLIFSNNS